MHNVQVVKHLEPTSRDSSANCCLALVCWMFYNLQTTLYMMPSTLANNSHYGHDSTVSDKLLHNLYQSLFQSSELSVCIYARLPVTMVNFTLSDWPYTLLTC